MVEWQICTLDHLNMSGFGRPPPRHGLQLLFWFAKHCVTFEPDNPADVMMLVLDCQPEKNVYGFHRFGNIEELLPILSKPKTKKSKKTKLAYFVVGNLSTKTYPESAKLPAYVREFYGIDGNYNGSNMDRIIISYQVKTRVVERVFITEHDIKDLGGFRSDGTHEISPELIQILQGPQLDLSTFLTSMGYYGDLETLQDTVDMTVSDQSVQMICDTLRSDPCWFFSEGVSYRPDLISDPSDWDQQDSFSTNSSVGPVVEFSEKIWKKKKSKPKKRQKVLRETYLDPRWELLYRAVDEEERRNKKKSGGDFSLFKILLGVGAIYLAAKCFSCLMRSCLNKSRSDYGVLQVYPQIFSQRTSSFPQTHVMLDYVY